MVEVGNIVTLDNNLDYLLLEKVEVDNVNYVYAIRVNEDESLTEEIEIFEVITNGEDEYLKVVPDGELKDKVSEIIKDSVLDKVAELDFETGNEA